MLQEDDVTRRLPLLLLALMVSALLPHASAPAAAQVDRVLRLDEAVERRIENAVAYVSVVYQKQDSTDAYVESGSAFFLTDTILVTNHHVVANALMARTAKVEVRVFSGTEQSRVLPVEILKADAESDLALLRTREPIPGVEPLQVARDLPGRQTEVYAFGFPLGTLLDKSANGPNVSLRRGYVSRLLDDGRYIEADVNTDKGGSGGPLVDAGGLVRGVVRSIAGSEYNRTYAGIAIASPTLIEFCKANGCPVTLKGGQVLQPGAPLPAPMALGSEPSPRPRPQLGDDALRAFFAAGAELRLNTLVPRLLVQEKAAYSDDVLQTSRGNLANLVTNLTKVGAPAQLRTEAQALSELLNKGQADPAPLADRADGLEKACDQWVRASSEEQRLNYDLGAWAAELSVGLISADGDVRTAEGFLTTARAHNGSAEVVQLLDGVCAGLRELAQQDSDSTRQAVRKGADRLLAIGYLAVAGDGLSPDAKPPPGTSPETTPSDRNRIDLRIP
jgi:hypothetical protein